ncbi:MAG: rhodanese-like domain-containing protein [Verrucomicrobiae bacterium]|nr:rhodanese-like domain-containing protein [Verrucomicrobiae bacterium]
MDNSTVIMVLNSSKNFFGWQHGRLLPQAVAFVISSVVLGIGTMVFKGKELDRHARELRDASYQPGLDLFPEEAEMRRVSLIEARNFLTATNSVVIDARPLKDFQKSHIAGAKSLSESRFDEAFAQQINLFAGKKKFMVYCDGQHCQMSLRVGQRLKEAGILDVAIFPGGWQQWREAHLPIESQ